MAALRQRDERAPERRPGERRAKPVKAPDWSLTEFPDDLENSMIIL
jgi:hypothetical protein